LALLRTHVTIGKYQVEIKPMEQQGISPIMTTGSIPPAGAATAAAPEPMYAHLAISDPEVLLAASEFPEGRARTDFFLTAIKIGVLSLRAARGVVDGEAIRKEGDQLMERLSERLNGWREVMETNMSKTLVHYLDPKEGAFAGRLERLVHSDGELVNVMRGQVNAAEQTLSKVFDQFIGENSNLLKILDPSGDNQLVATLQKTLDEVVKQQNVSILNQFSLDEPNSAVNRFMRELTGRTGDLHQALATRMGEVTSEFSLDRPDSALSRLVGRVEAAQKTLTQEMSLDNQGSALQRLQQRLDEHHQRQMAEAAKLNETLNLAIGALQGRKEEAAKSTRHGFEFEASVGEVVRRLAVGDVVQDSGATTGVISNCKVGDFVVTVGPEKTAAGARIVIEAKESAAYDLARTLEEADLARRNRGAGICLFVHSDKTAGPSIPVFARYGHDVVLRWNAEDDASDVQLQAAMMLATALSVRAAQHDKGEAASFAILDKAIEAIRKNIDGLDEITTCANTSTRAAATIIKRAEIMKESLLAKVSAACEQIEKLKASSSQEE
jgi:hypothetical protein